LCFTLLNPYNNQIAITRIAIMKITMLIVIINKTRRDIKTFLRF